MVFCPSLFVSHLASSEKGTAMGIEVFVAGMTGEGQTIAYDGITKQLTESSCVGWGGWNKGDAESMVTTKLKY